MFDVVKVCSCCLAGKSLSEYHKQKKGKFGVTSRCKTCTSRYASEWAQNNKERIRQNQRNWASRNKEKVRAYSIEWRLANAEKEKIRLANWAKENSARANEKVAARRAMKLNATPLWSDKNAIANIYKAAKQLRETTGIKWNVDHVIPLKSDVVCGLHVRSNLLIITEAANKSKGNYFDTDECILFDEYGMPYKTDWSNHWKNHWSKRGGIECTN